MYKRIFLFLFLCTIAAVEACSFRSINLSPNPGITDSLTYFLKTEYGNSSFKQDYRIKLDSTLKMRAQRIHALHLIGEIYISEFKMDRDIEFSKLSLQALGDSLQILAAEEFSDLDPDRIYNYYNTYEIMPYFVNDKLSIYQINQASYWGGAHPNWSVNYYCVDKRSDTSVFSNQFFDESKVGMNKLIEKYLLLFVSEVMSEEITDVNKLEEYGFWITENIHSYATYAFTDKEMLCIFNHYTIAPYSAGMITLKIPIEEAKPFLSDTLKELLF